MERKKTRTYQNRTACSKEIDARKISPSSETTSPTATISTLHTMRSSSLEPGRTPPSNRTDTSRSPAKDEESERDSLSVLTPSQPLHDKLDELQHRWSEKRPPRVEHQSSKSDTHYAFAAGGRILHTPGSLQRADAKASPSKAIAREETIAARKRGPTVEIIGSPDQFPLRQERQSVFDRLYQQGKSSPASRRRRRRPAGRDGRTYHSMPMPATPQSSVEGTISTLSSSESVFDRLYKNEKRNRVHSPRRRAYHSDSMSASASLERRLSYQAPPPPVKRRNLVSSSGKVASLIQQHESRKGARNDGTPRSDYSPVKSPQTKSPDGKSVTFDSNSLFDRLYRGEKRPMPSLTNKQSTGWPVKTKRTVVNSSSSTDSTHPLPSDSIFERLYKGEKRKSLLLHKRKRLNELIITSDSSTTIADRRKRPSEIDVRYEQDGTLACDKDETALLEDALRTGDDSDDSLLHLEMVVPTVLHFAASASSDGNPTTERQGSPVEFRGTKRISSRDSECSTLRDTLARLKLQLYVRRIQRCARRYIAKSCANKKRPSRALVQSHDIWEEGQEDRSAVLIQSLWRSYHFRVETVTALVQQCELDCNILSSNEYSRFLMLRIRIESLSRAIADIGAARMAKLHVDEHSISLEWSKQVLVHFKHGGLSRMESVVVAVKCRMINFLLLTRWTSQTLSSIVVRAELFKAYQRALADLTSASLYIIRAWARVVLRKRRSSNRGHAFRIRTSGLLSLAQYLTPTSLQQRSAVTLQSAWRFHLSQVRAAGAMLTSWQVTCDAESKVHDNGILGRRVGVVALLKAIGRVDCWWITEGVFVGDHRVSIKWKREVGVHFTQKGVPKLETCSIEIDCQARRTVFLEMWGRRKLTILIVKAVLNRVTKRDRSYLWDKCATLIQTWYRMKCTRFEYLRRVYACRTIQRFFRSFPFLSAEERSEKQNQIATDGFDEEGGDHRIRGDEGVDPLFLRHESAATIIQTYARCFLVVRQMQRQDRAGRIVQCSPRHQLACLHNHRREEDLTVRERMTAAASTIQSRYRVVLATQVKSATAIERAYRARRVRSSLQTVLVGIIKLQAAHRGIMARRLIFLWQALVEQSRLAVLVQKHWRGCQVRREYDLVRRSAILIQLAYRKRYCVTVSMEQARRSEIQAQSVTSVFLQKAWGGPRSRAKVHEMLVSRRADAAIAIQNRYRCFELRSDFLTLRQAATCIQTFERRRKAILKYRSVLAGCILMQALFRGVRTRTLGHRNRVLAVLVQAVWRGSRSQKHFAAFRSSAVLIQSACRRRSSLMLMRRVKAAVIKIQSWYRCFEVRSDFLALRQAVTDIQTFQRQRKAFLKYQRVVAGSILAQALFRGAQARRLRRLEIASVLLVQAVWRGSCVQSQFVSFRNSIVILQSACRRRKTRMLTRRIEAAVKIQSWYRCFELRRDFLTLRQAVVIIQAFGCRRKIFLRYQRVFVGCVRLQALFRGAQARRLRRLEIASALLVQAAWRGSRVQRQFVSFRESMIVLQTEHRRRKAMYMPQTSVACVVYLQALFRGNNVRRVHSKQVCAAVKVQAAWRGERCRDHLSAQLIRQYNQPAVNGVVVLQDLFRASLRHRERSSVLIQSAYRQYVSRKRFNNLKQAVIKIEAGQRRRHALSEYSRLVLGAISLQAHYRGRVTRQALARRAQSIDVAASLIQRCWRRYSLRLNFLTLKMFAVRMQRSERRRQARTSYKRVLLGTTRLQARHRGTMTRRMLATHLKAAEAVQRWFRGCILRLNFATLKRFAIRIQAMERRRQSLSMFSRALHGTVCLQANYRGLLTRRRLAERAQAALAAAVLIQSSWRRYSFLLGFQSLRAAAVRIQAVERRRSCVWDYTLILVGIIRLQARCRGHQAKQAVVRRRAVLEDIASICIQSHWRRFYMRRNYMAATNMIVRLQAAARRRKYQVGYTNVRIGVVCLQAQFRGFFVRQILTELAAAVIIQSWYRVVVPRRHFLSSRQAAVLIQTTQRRRQVQLRYNSVQRGCVHFQKCIRGLLARSHLKLRRLAACRIQAAWRASHVSKHFVFAKSGALALPCAFRRRRAQRMLRRFLIGLVLVQAAQRGVMARRHLFEQCMAAATIQKMWGNYRHLRRSGPSSPSNRPGKAYDPIHFAALLIQSRVRAFMAKLTLGKMQVSARLIQVKYFTWKMQIAVLMVQSSVVLLQRSVRAQLLRSAARFALSHINSSLCSPIIDSFARVTSRADFDVSFVWREWTIAVDLAREAACIVIQSAIRRLLAIRFRNEARMNQPTGRQLLSRNVVSAFKSIKTISSGVSSEEHSRSRIPRILDSAVTAISTVNLSRNIELERKRSESAAVIQHMVRRCRTRHEMRKYRSASQLQRTFRRRSKMAMYARCRAGVVTLQSCFRGARARLEIQARTLAAARIQQAWRTNRESWLLALPDSNCRTHSTSYSVQARCEAASLIQRKFRARQQAKNSRSVMVAKYRATVALQTKWRAFRERQRYQTALNSVLVVQALCRMRTASRSYNMRREASNVIQRRFRSCQQRDVVRSTFVLKRLASVRLQQVWRMRQERQRLRSFRKMAVLIQSFYRTHSASRAFYRQVEAVWAVQTMYRRFRHRRAYMELRKASVRLQALVRQVVARTALLTALASASTIQRIWRVVLQRRANNANHVAENDRKELLADESRLSPLVNGTGHAMGVRWMHDSIVAQVEDKSMSEVDRLLEGDIATLECTGICIGRLVSRVAEAQQKARTVANDVVVKQQDTTVVHQNHLLSTKNGDCLQVNTNREPDDKRRCEASLAVKDAREEGGDVAIDQCATTSEANVTVPAMEDTSDRDTVDLAARAQQLLVEARRARTKFQKSRTRVRQTSDSKSCSPIAEPLASQTQMGWKTSKQTTQMFGDNVQEKDLPSPIRAKDEWDWTKDWK